MPEQALTEEQMMYYDAEQGPTMHVDHAERKITIYLAGCTMTPHGAAAAARRMVDDAIRGPKLWPNPFLDEEHG